MATPRFTFTAYTNSFKVIVENLEELSVEQIQEIEAFVLKRKGVFDFHNYSFSIQKRLGFSEFVQLLKELELNARCVENIQVPKIRERISFGQYKGMLYSELPDSYLLWLKNNHNGKDRDKVLKESQKRKL
jgi:DNA polymerase III subunit epsilon